MKYNFFKKRKSLILFLTAILSFPIAAKNKSFKESIFQSVQAETGIVLPSGFSKPNYFINGTYHFDSSLFSAAGGMNFSMGYNSYADITAAGTWWALKNTKLKVGPSLCYHFQGYYGISVCSDFLAGAELFWHPVKFFGLHHSFNFMLKMRSIADLPRKNRTLVNRTLAAALEAQIFPTESFSIDLALLSYEPFRYLAFVQPEFRMGGSYQFTQKLRAKLYATIRYLDFFTNSGNLTEFESKFCMEVLI